MNRSNLPHLNLQPFYLTLLFGAIVLPMLPVWQGGIRTLAACAVMLAITWHFASKMALGLFLLGAALISLRGWFVSLRQNPAGHVIHALTDVFGQPTGVIPDLSLLVFDLLVLSILSALLWHRHSTLLPRIFISSLALFWLLSLSSVASLAIMGLPVDTLAQTMTALSGWATWVYWGFLGLLLFRTTHQIEAVIKVIVIASLVVGGVIMAQWSTGDYSYYLGSLDGSSDPFYRVRGTNYYHAPTSLITALGAIACIGLMRKRLELWPALGAAFLVGMTILNNTRAISLTLIVGLLTLTVLCSVRRAWSVALFALFACFAVLPNIIYLKPPAWLESTTTHPLVSIETTGESSEPIQNNEQKTETEHFSEHTIEPAQTLESHPSIQSVAGANAPRTSLAYAGLSLIPKHLLLGAGPGILDLQLEGNTFDGITSTYSTHVLYLDLLLMGGGLAFVLLMLAMAVSVGNGLIHIRRQSPATNGTSTPFLGMLLAFAVASLFLPQERNEVIGLAFACTGLLMFRQTDLSLESYDQTVKLPKFWLANMAAGAIVWAILTSPVYVFPSIELIGRHGSEIVKKRQMVMLTESTSKPLLKTLLKLRGGEEHQIGVLPDDTKFLEVGNAWVLWNPTREANYPTLIKHLETQGYPRHLYPLGIGTPAHWWVVPSAQPVVTFLFAGARHAFDVDQKFFPNIATLLDIQVSDNVGGNSTNIADRNYSSAVSWDSSTVADIVFDLPEHTSGKFSAYRLVSLNHRSTSRSTLYTWQVTGQLKNGEWVIIDEQKQIPVSQVAHEPSLFLVPTHTMELSRIRFKFLPDQQSNSSVYSGLSEIELYFSPDSLENAINKTHENQ